MSVGKLGAMPRLALMVLFFVCLALGGYTLFAQAKGLTWQFDDMANLRGLTDVNSTQAVINFVFGGSAGPTGRPVSLLSFVPNAGDWPDNPWGFVKTSLLWHLLNAMWVAVIAYLALSIQDRYRRQAWWLACVTAFFWSLAPIQASAILMPVQRMTLVSAFFSLATIAYYMFWRVKYRDTATLAQLVVMSAVISLGVLLSLFSKENGALTILYVGICELFLLKNIARPTYAKLWGLWQGLALASVPVFLCAYAVSGWQGISHSYTYYREFSLSQRLATEAVILFDYLKQTLLPRAAEFGPFHDGYPIYGWQMYQPWLALFGWLVLLIVAAFIYIKKSDKPWSMVLAFAICFYISAHLVESTFIPLELYFEHRNYIAILGLAMLLAVTVAEALLVTTTKAAVWVIAILYGSFQVISTQQVASLWGQPLFAAEMWAMQHPDSPRAIQTLSWQYSEFGFRDASVEILDDFYAAHPQHVSVGMGALTVTCGVNDIDDAELLARLDLLIAQADRVKAPLEFTTGLANFGVLIRESRCGGITVEEYQSYLSHLLELPRIVNNPRVRHHIYYEMALNYQTLGDERQYIDYAKKAFYDYPSLTVAQLVGASLFKIQENQEAIKWTEEALTYAPNNASRKSWEISLNSFKKAVEDTEAYINTNGENDE